MATLESKSTDAQSLEQMFDAKHQTHLQGYLRWKGVQDRVLATILLVPAIAADWRAGATRPPDLTWARYLPTRTRRT